MILLGEIKNRKIFYTTTNSPNYSLSSLPNSNWLAFVVSDEMETEVFSNLADLCIEKNVAYVCTAGPSCELVHDIFDEVVVAKEISKGQSVETSDDFENSPMTTWHHNFDEGFWFALIAAHNDPYCIKEVICIDLTRKGVLNYLKELTNKIQSGWIPSDDEVISPKFDSPVE